MPIYDFRCYVCGYIEENVFHMEDLGACKKCGSKSWSKVTPAPNFKVIGGTEKFYNRGEKK